jgi:hypothetical protein
MVPARDVQQWKQACREAGLDDKEREIATREFHAEKKASGEKDHWPYRKLINWLREWKEDRWLS